MVTLVRALSARTSSAAAAAAALRVASRASEQPETVLAGRSSYRILRGLSPSAPPAAPPTAVVKAQRTSICLAPDVGFEPATERACVPWRAKANNVRAAATDEHHAREGSRTDLAQSRPQARNGARRHRCRTLDLQSPPRRVPRSWPSQPIARPRGSMVRPSRRRKEVSHRRASARSVTREPVALRHSQKMTSAIEHNHLTSRNC